MLKIRDAQRSRAVVEMVLVLLAVGMAGCGKKIVRPTVDTHPVTGKVTAQPGRLPPGSTIVFEPSDAQLTARGIIGEDGSFTLKTVFHESKLVGAVEGEHRVTIVPALTPDGGGGGPPIILKEHYTVKPEDNHFTIEVR